MKLQIDSLDLQEEAFQPLVAMIATSIDEAMKTAEKRKELPRYMKKKEACEYLSCSYNTLQKLIRNGLKVIIVDGVERIYQKDVDSFMEQFKK